MWDKNEVSSLLVFLTNHKYRNLHTRKTYQVKNKKVLKHLHGIKLASANLISGYFCGPLNNSKLSEIEYEIECTGTVRVKFIKGITKPKALDYIDSERKSVIKKIEEKSNNWSPNYLKNNFYLRRSNKKTPTLAAKKAVSDEMLSNRFIMTMVEWGLSIIEGQK